MQKAQTNLFPAFEGPEHQNLHTKGKECVCNPYFKVEMRDDAEITHFRHQPLTEVNKAKPPEWLPKNEVDWVTVSGFAQITAGILKAVVKQEYERYGVLLDKEVQIAE